MCCVVSGMSTKQQLCATQSFAGRHAAGSHVLEVVQHKLNVISACVHRLLLHPQGKLGGGEGVEGLYGSITRSGMQKVVAALQSECGLNRDSCLVDIGAGLGRSWPPPPPANMAASRMRISLMLYKKTLTMDRILRCMLTSR